MREKILKSLMRPWLLAGAATVALAGPVAADYSYVERDSFTGPNVWGNIAGYETCGILDTSLTQWTGVAQSPVNIAEVITEPGPALEFHYSDTPLIIANTGHTIEVPIGSGNVLLVGTDEYTLEAIQFHVGSEHTYLGAQYDMEAHLVHRGPSGVAIVAVFLAGGATQNDFVNPVFTNAPSWGTADMSPVTVNALDLLAHATPMTTSGGSTAPADTTASEQPVDQPLTVEEEKAAWKAKKQELKAKWKEEKLGWKEEWNLRWQEFKASIFELFGKSKEARDIRRAARLEYKAAKMAAWEELKAQKQQERLEFRAAKKAAMKAARARRKGKDEPPADDPSPPDPAPPGDATAKMANTYFTYTGSLTAPPCTEGVRWFVLPHEVAVLQSSVDKMHDMVLTFPVHNEYWVNLNNRPVQPLNDRVVKQIVP